MRTRALSIAVGLTVIAALLAIVPISQTRFGFSPSYAYAFTCPTPEGGPGTDNGNGTFNCDTQISEGVIQTQIYNGDGTLASTGNTNVAGGGQINTSNDPAGPVKCSGWTNFFYNPSVCIGRSIAAFIGTALITLTAWLLQVAGLIFNWLMYYTVIAFGDAQNGFLTPGVLNAINLTWSAFRDISNIVIIGLFTFIAISIILGLNQFGNKKLIARVLIVAILINFSLLFTKIIIDFSNFTSYVFYNSASALTQTTPQSLTSPFVQDGVAGQFIRFMGVTSVSDTFSTLKQGADNADSGWIILLHGLFGATLLLLAAIAFLYGAFLLTVRAVVLIFLLITSSFAFATYLIPKLSESSYGWNAWWKALFQNAIFAPLLMALLWATLALATALRPAGGTLGGLLSDPSNAGNLSALFSYIIVLGFLVASFKVSSSFSSAISGFNFAAMNIARLGVAPLALGSRFLAAPALRRGIGGASAEEAKILAEQIKKETQNAASARAQNRPYDIAPLTKLMKQKEAADARAKRDFNLMNTTAGKQLAQAAGLSGFLAGEKKVGGFVGPRKAAAEEAAKKVSDVGLSKEQKEQIAGSIKENMQAEQAPQREAFQQLQKAASAQLESARSTAKAAQRSERLQEKQIDAEREIQAAITEKGLIGERHRTGAIDQARHDQEMRAQDDRIKVARETIEQAKGRAQEIENLHLADPRAKIAEARKGLADLDSQIQKAVGNITDAEIGIKTEMAQELAHHPDKYTSDQIRANVSKQVKSKRLKERLKAEKEIATEEGEEVTTPAKA